MTAIRRSHRLRHWLLAAAMVALVVGAPATAAQAAPADTPDVPDLPTTQGGNGGLTPADIDFVQRVRLAGLWEIPAGNMAQQKGTTPVVKSVGKEIAKQHVLLDKLTRDDAARLRIPLPDVPSDQQQGWLLEMQRASGITFDQIFVARLRAAHGSIFSAIANIRAGTRNDIVRELAQQANQYVMTHMSLLETSGLVDYGQLPAPPQPAPINAKPNVNSQALTVAGASASAPGGMSTPVVLLVLAAAVVAGLVTTMRILRPR
jgi:putative membrane protein